MFVRENKNDKVMFCKECGYRLFINEETGEQICPVCDTINHQEQEVENHVCECGAPKCFNNILQDWVCIDGCDLY